MVFSSLDLPDFLMTKDGPNASNANVVVSTPIQLSILYCDNGDLGRTGKVFSRGFRTRRLYFDLGRCTGGMDNA